jgi:proteic killer suppression protein
MRLTEWKLRVYTSRVIRSFRSKALTAFWNRGDAAALDSRLLAKLKTRLSRLDAAVVPTEMNAPGHHFHEPKGDRKGAFSVRVTGNWRLTFRWDGTDATEVELEDYH